MSPRHWPERIEDILAAVDEIQAFTAGMTFEDFRNDPKTIKAVTANFAIVGEAARHIPDKVAAANPAVPWQVMRAMRNVVVHVYFAVDPQVLWDTIHSDLPQVVPQLKQLLARSE